MSSQTELDELVSFIESATPEDWKLCFDAMDDKEPGNDMDVIRSLPTKYPGMTFRDILRKTQVIQKIKHPSTRRILACSIRHVLHLHNQ